MRAFSEIKASESGGLLLVDLKGLTFWAVFVFVFLFSGPLTVLGAPFRLSPVALLALPLVLLYGVRIGLVEVIYGLLAAEVIASGFLNGSSVSHIAIFARSLVVSYLIYRLVAIYANERTLPTIIRLCIVVGAIQLPVIVLERLFYDILPAANNGVIFQDIGMGTFRDDSALSFFLNLLIVFLLFSPRRALAIVRHRWLTVAWFTLTVFVAHSEISKLTLIVIWTVYVFRMFNVRKLVFTIAVLGSLIGILYAAGVRDEPVKLLRERIEAPVANANATRSYLGGSYARGAAIMYFVHRGIRWFGDGPMRYTNPITRTRARGNTGHFFVYYSEVGLLGWLLSVLVFFRIAFRDRPSLTNLINILAFVSIQVLSLTSQVLNNISIMLIYCIVVSVMCVRIDVMVRPIRLGRGFARRLGREGSEPGMPAVTHGVS